MGGVELTGNGKVDLAPPRSQVVSAIPEGELGSAYSGESLFWRFDSGRVFEVGPVETQQLDDMVRRDGKAKTLREVLTLPLRSAEWSIEPAQGDRGEAEFARDALTRPANAGGMKTPIELVIGQMTTAVLYRRSYFEKVFLADEGRVRYQKIAFRPARTCWLLRDKRDYSFQGFKQKLMRDNNMVDVTIPPQKAFVYIHGQHQDPLYGMSDLETAYAIFDAKQKVRFLWYSFLENQTIPKAIAQVDGSDSKAAQELAEKVATLKGGGVIGTTANQSVSPFESSGRGAAEFRAAMDYLSVEMAGSVLAAFTELPADGKGSYALSKDQSDFFLRACQAKLSEMGAAITSWLIADLIRWNYGTTAAVPTFRFGPLTHGDVQQPLELLQALATTPATNPALPAEFIDLLVVRVASLLGLDTDTVEQAIKGKGEEAQTPGAELRAGIEAAHRMVQEAGATAPA